MRCFMVIGVVFIISGCSARVDEVGVAPKMSSVGSGINSTPYVPPNVTVKPQPQPANFSLWPGNRESIFHDQRAKSKGDVLTVFIQINDKADLANKSKRSRKSNNEWRAGADFSYEGTMIPKAGQYKGGIGANVDNGTKFDGSGSVARSEKINLSIAAVITQILPNGNYVISGTQEVLVNFEMRILSVKGIVRPQDVTQANTVTYEKIAEARIAYGGRGRSMEVQQPGFLQQIITNLTPF